MKQPVRRVSVLGAGVMGSGIAAHVANAGIPVTLLDIVPPNDSGAKDPRVRNKFADGAVKTMLKTKPAPFFSKANAKLVTTGNLEDDLESACQADLVIEAVVERLDIKKALFARMEKCLPEHAVVASNTSGLRIVDMLEGRSASFQEHFLVMHFFNPPRYMKLLELVAGPKTSAKVLEQIRHFGADVLGKGIVFAKDCPNFVANRIGTHNMMGAIHLMLEKGLAPEDLDALTGVPMGHPRSATFRTGDLVGVDTLAHVVRNCHAALENDEEREVFVLPKYIENMIEKKQLGRKTNAGFYKKTKAGIETLDPTTGEYRAKGGNEEIKKACKGLAKEEDPKKRVKALVATDGIVGEFAWEALSKGLAYTARRVGEIADDIDAIDNAMCWGYNFELGPFQTWDALGFQETYDRMVKDGIALPDWLKKMRDSGASGFYKEDGSVYDWQKASHVSREKDPREVDLVNLRIGDAPVVKNGGAEAWDLGDGVLGFTFRTKANSIDPNVIEMLGTAIDKAETDFRAMLVTNQGDHFCVGANLFLVVMASQQKNWEQIRDMVKGYQNATQRLKYSTVPVVAAPYGMTVGGGMELCFACDSVQAAAETYSGLVEVGVGLIPGGAGNLNMLWRALEGIPDGVEADTYAFVTQVFKNIAMARVATSAGEAKEFGYFRHTDGISFDRARQLWEAKQRAVAMADAGYHAPIRRAYKLPGESGIATLQMMVNTLVAGGFATAHDGVVAGHLARVLCGGAGGASREVTEDEMLELEAEAFVSLCGEKKSQERMQHMLMKNKPLRN